jgi:hypothetical protein
MYVIKFLCHANLCCSYGAFCTAGTAGEWDLLNVKKARSAATARGFSWEEDSNQQFLVLGPLPGSAASALKDTEVRVVTADSTATKVMISVRD